MNVFCVLMTLGALGAAAWALIGGEVAAEGLDAIFLVAVAGLTAVIFSVIPLRALRRVGIGGLRARLAARHATHEEHKVHA